MRFIKIITFHVQSILYLLLPIILNWTHIFDNGYVVSVNVVFRKKIVYKVVVDITKIL